MPLSESQQARLDEIKTNLGYTADMLQGMQAFPRQIAALEKLDTRGQELDFDSLTMDEMRDIYERGRVNSDINACALEHPFSPGNLQQVTLEYGFETDENAGLRVGTKANPIETSRESLEKVMFNWMHANDHAIDPRNISAAQINILGSIDRGLGGKIEKAKFDYMNLQEEIKLSTGENFRDPAFEASYQSLKQQAEELITFANDAQSSLALKGAANSIEAAASQNLTADQTSKVIFEAKRFITGTDTPAIDLTGRNLKGLDIGESDLSGIKIDAVALSRATSIKSSLGVDPDLKAAAIALRPQVEALDALQAEQQAIRESLPTTQAAKLVGRINGSTRAKEDQIAELEEQIQNLQAEVNQSNVIFTPPPRQAAVTYIAPPKPEPLPLHKQLETTDTYVVGAGALEPKISSAPANAMQKAQASESFKVSGSQVLDSKGATTAFAKKPLGSRSQALRESGADEMALQQSLGKDGDQIGTVAPLYGASAKVGDCNATDVSARLQAINGDLSSLPSRSVASSVVNKALQMDAVAEEKFGVDLNGVPHGISVGVAGAAIRTRPSDPTEPEAFLDIDYTQAQIQKGLFDLEAQDYITGQIDRHGGNIFIDPHNQEVRGIDNDLAFPVVDRAEMVKNGDVNNKAVATLPMFVHEDTAAKIMALSPEALRQSLEAIEPPRGVGRLEPAAIDGACKRLVELQAHVQSLDAQGKLVKEFNMDTFQQARQAQLALSGNPPELGGVNHGSLQRASYLGTALIEKARTESLNAMENKPWEHRKLLDENDVPKPAVNLVYAKYQADVQAAREEIDQNDPDIARIRTEIASLESDLTWQINDVDSMRSALEAAERVGNPARIADASSAYEGALSTVEETKEKIALAQEKIELFADYKLESMKPRLAVAAYELEVAEYAHQEVELQGALQEAQAEIEAIEQEMSVVLDEIAAKDLGAAKQEGVEDLQQKRVDAQVKLENIQSQLEACQSKKADLKNRMEVTLTQNPEWQRIPEPQQGAKQSARLNIGTRAVPPAADENVQPLDRSPRPRPPSPGDKAPTEGLEVKAEKHKVKQDILAHDDPGKHEHHRQNSTGAAVQWKRTAPAKGQDHHLGTK